MRDLNGKKHAMLEKGKPESDKKKALRVGKDCARVGHCRL